VPEAVDSGDPNLPPDVRRRLEQFLQRVDRLRVEDLPMFAAQPLDKAEHDESVNAATRAAFDAGRRIVLDEARRELTAWLNRLYSRQQAYPEWAGPSMSRSVGTAGDRAAIHSSLMDVMTALVLWDVLDEVYRDHLVGPWGARIEDEAA
jgi:hypothetical protein